MRIRKIATLAILAVAIAMPGVSLAKNKDKHGIGKGGVPALRDQIYAMIDDLQDQIDGALRRIRRLENGAEATNAELAALDARLAALESQFVDDDGDTFSEVQDDCDDTDADVSPLADEIAGNGLDDDANGYIDDVRGIDVVNGDTDPMDDYGHGTHVAGTIGAIGNNALGVVGVNWNVKILPCKILDSTGSGTIADAVTCLEYARALKAAGVNIVATNNSYGGLSAFSQTMYDAIDAQRDILFVAAAGNSGLDNDTVDFYPADFNLPNVISVAATDHTDQMPSFSHFGRRSVHIGAPGVNIWSTLNFNSYLSADGTSMASPHVAGLAALLKAQPPQRDWRAIKNLILSGADPRPSLAGKTITGGRLNAFNAVSCVSRPLFSMVTVPAAFTVGVPNTVSALSINCGNAVGPVTARTSLGQTFTLLDNGVAPDLAAGDGLFTATWTPTQAFAFIDFSSPAGTERLGAVDLTLAAVGGPASANRGDTVTLSATLSNPSSTAAPASTLNFYLSVDGIITTADTLVASVATPALAAGTQHVLAASAAIPSTLAVGNYFVGAIVDPANTIAEGDETNNARSGNVMAVSNIATDLAASAVSGPATAFTGDAVTLSASVTNLGTVAASPSTLYFFLASNPSLSSSYVLVGTAAVGALAGGAAQIVSGSFPIPVTLPPGTYTIVAEADGPHAMVETNEANNTGAGNLITTSTRNVDLTITSVTSPTSANVGASILITGKVKNQGTASAPASNIRWYLSTDNIITTADRVLASVSNAAMNAGSSRSHNVTTKVPGKVAAGTYYIGAIIDPGNLIPETQETNNVRVSANTTVVSYAANLAMTAVAGPTSGATGQNVTFTGTLANQSGAAVNQSIKVGFYLSSDSTIKTSDSLIATATVASLGANSSINLSVTAALRTGLTAGTYYVGAIADYDNLVPESNNNNNAKSGNTIAVTYGPDLVMTVVAAPPSVTRGQAVTVTGTVKNQGVGAFGALSDLDSNGGTTTIRIGFYLSTNATITADDTRIGAVTLSSVPAGTSVPLSVSALIPTGLVPGTYYIGAIADDLGGLRESSEINNALPGNMVNVR